mgnify:CR=1 FL=1
MKLSGVLAVVCVATCGLFTTLVAPGTTGAAFLGMAAPLIVGIIGLIVEWVLIRFLYGRMVDTLLATWGLSLFFIGLVTSIFGAQTATTIAPPFGPITIGEFSSSGYELFLILVAILLVGMMYFLLRYTKLGLVARGTMQAADMAAALGVSTQRVYSTTFGIGAALSGLAGGLLAPITGILPTIGAIYIGKAFITVISGGTAILAGTASASILLGGINGIVSFVIGPTMGEVALLLLAIFLLRLMPRGITGRFFKRSL